MSEMVGGHGPARVAVFDPVGTYQQGILVALSEAGFDAVAPRVAPLQWLAMARCDAIVLGHAGDAEPIVSMAAVADRGPEAVVALLDEFTGLALLELLKRGVSVCRRDAPVQAVASAVEESLRGRVVVSREVMVALARGELHQALDDPLLLDRDRELLDLLATDLTVDEIARTYAVSKRTAERRLKALYARLGVTSRAEAVAVASGRGLLGN